MYLLCNKQNRILSIYIKTNFDILNEKKISWNIGMKQKEPIKITLGLILRWILGTFFLLVGFGTALGNEYFAAMLMILGAFVLIPPISQIVESKLNISLSGTLRLVIVILLFVGFAFATPPTTPSKITDSDIHK